MDLDIIRKATYGDEEAFEMIYDSYHKKVYSMALQFFHDESIAEDIVQNTFIRVHRHIQNLQTLEAFHTWILKIAYHECLDYSKKKYREVEHYTDFNITEYKDQKTTKEAHKKLKAQEINDIILNEIEHLDFKSRTIAYLQFYEGISIKEIAKIVDMPEGTVKSRIHYIKKDLQKVLTKKGITPETYLTPENLSGIYVMVKAPIQKSKLMSTADAFIKSLTAKTVIITTISTVSVISTCYISYQYLTQNQQVPAVIQKVEYNTDYTNQNIPLNITVSNSNYNEITIDDQKTTSIQTNGEHSIQLIKDGKIIDTYQLHIQNIDKTPPSIINTQDYEDKTVLYLEDKESGINKQRIKYIHNDVESQNYDYNENNQTLTIPYQSEDKNTIYMSDNAGNMIKFDIQY